jgi:isocitrate lyase
MSHRERTPRQPVQPRGGQYQLRGITVETITEQAANLRKAWETDRRWAGIRRDYTAGDVIRLRGLFAEEHTHARRGAQRLWELLQSEDAVRAFGAITGNQAVRQVKAGLQAIYLPR